MTLGPQFPKMVRRANLLGFSDPENAFSQCRNCAADARRHIGGELVRFSAPVDLSNAHDRWRDMVDEREDHRRYISHTVNRVGNTIVDFTGSQFWGRNTPVPIVEPEEVYKARFGSHDGVDDSDITYTPGDYATTRREDR